MGNLGPGDTGVVHLFSDSLSSGPSEMLAALLAPASWLLTGFAALAIVLIVVLLITGPLTKNRGAIRSFYGEDRRHAPKAETGFHGFRLTLKEPVDASAVRERVLSMLKKEGSRSMLRIRLISAKQYTYSAAADADVADEMLGVASSSVHEPAGLSAVSNEMWKRGSPLMIWINGRTVDMCAHHAVFDGVRGCRLLNELLGNLGKKGAIRPDQLPCCMLACSMRTLARVFVVDVILAVTPTVVLAVTRIIATRRTVSRRSPSRLAARVRSRRALARRTGALSFPPACARARIVAHSFASTTHARASGDARARRRIRARIYFVERIERDGARAMRRTNDARGMNA